MNILKYTAFATLIIFVGVVGIVGIIKFCVWAFDSSDNIKTEEVKLIYSYNRCYDNETVSQEYIDTKIQEEYSQAQETYGICSYTSLGRKDIIGCVGDQYYSFSCQ